jgi:hypothetical protein
MRPEDVPGCTPSLEDCSKEQSERGHATIGLPQTLKNSAAVQEYLAVEFGLRKSYILVGSGLPGGGWESWIDKRKRLESVINLPCGGRGTRRADQQPITHAKTRLKTKTNSNEGARSAMRTSIKSHSMSLNWQ